MLSYMLDTGICLYLIKDRLPELRGRFREATGRLCISSISLAELHYGAEKSARPRENFDTLERFVARLPVLAFGGQAAAHYGQLRALLERAGMPCGQHDIQIGAHARSEGLIVVTNNTREFVRMPGLRVENWV